jgi:hypothetical protein
MSVEVPAARETPGPPATSASPPTPVALAPCPSTGAPPLPPSAGPIVGTTTTRSHRNVIGTHSGSYSVYRALAVAAGALSSEPQGRPDQHRPHRRDRPLPAVERARAHRVLDPWGATVGRNFAAELAAGYDIKPTIAVTKAHVILPEVMEALQKGRLKADGKVLTAGGAAMVTKVAVEPVWYLPGVARRFGCSESDLRRVLFEETGGMYPELVTRSDLEVFLPPIGGLTLYIFGNPRDLANPEVRADRPRARRVQWLGRVWLRHLHLPPVPDARD